jgi:MFS family permease
MSRADAHDPLAPFRSRDYRRFSALALLAAMIERSQGVAIGWDVYERTGSALALGALGLVQFLPVLALFLPAGHLADRFDRRWVLLLSFAAWGAANLLLAVISLTGGPAGWIYLAAAGLGSALVINRPARDALLAQLAPPETLARAVAWNSSLFQFASVAGPAAAGTLIAATGTASSVYLANVGFAVLAAAIALAIRRRPIDHAARARSLRDLLGGVEHVWRTKPILGVITLDLFAVLFGGATALFPIFAKDILHVGPAGLGWLTAAPAVGALAMAVVQGAAPPLRRAGRVFVWAVAGYGLAMIVFGLSTWFWLSLAALVAAGALDNLSVVIRATVVQLYAPDALRGRVSAVNRVFISSSNELGAFESGVLAAFIGPVATVVFGGVATIALVLGALRLFPDLARLGRLSGEAGSPPARG